MARAPLCEPVRLAPGAALRIETVALGPQSPANARLNHFHDLAEIVLFERIGGQLILGETPVELSDGMAVYIPPLAYHDFALAPGAKAWRLIQFDPTLKRGGVTVPTAPVAPTTASDGSFLLFFLLIVLILHIQLLLLGQHLNQRRCVLRERPFLGHFRGR